MSPTGWILVKVQYILFKWKVSLPVAGDLELWFQDLYKAPSISNYPMSLWYSPNKGTHEMSADSSACQ